MIIDIFEIYLLYQKYWLSRKFVDIFGYNFLTNNMRIINKFFGFEDLGDLKQICWYLIDPNISSATTEKVEDFAKKLENSKYKDTINYHLRFSIDGLKQRREHFAICHHTLSAIKKLLNSEIIDDNIYNLNANYKPNFFEEELIIQAPYQPIIYSDFVRIVKENIKGEFAQENMKFDFMDTSCSS